MIAENRTVEEGKCTLSAREMVLALHECERNLSLAGERFLSA